jgi:hypothetical protein
MSNYALDTPIKRNVYVPDTDIPFAPAFSPPNPPETDQTHRAMTWQFDNRQKVVGTQDPPKSARLEKKK